MHDHCVKTCSISWCGSILLITLVTSSCGDNILDSGPEPQSRNVEPSWSPDGDRVAYVHFADNEEEFQSLGGWQIWVYSFSSDSSTYWTRGREPAWSPDGSRIAFTGQDGNVWIISENNVLDPTRITNIGGASGSRWFPDGHHILFRRWPPREPFYFYSVADDGTELTWTGISGTSFEFLGDGSSIVFTDLSERKFFTIALGEPPDSASLMTDVSPLFARHLHTRPGTQEIGYFRFGDGTRKHGLWLISPLPIHHKMVTLCNGDFSWAPDGERFVFESYDEHYMGDLWIMTMGSDHRERLLGEPSDPSP